MQICNKKRQDQICDEKKPGCQYPRIQIVLNIEKKTLGALERRIKAGSKMLQKKKQDPKFLPCPP